MILMHLARYFLITGKVQGVGYRYFAMRAANQYQISGYVRNLASGQVEIVAEGQREAMESFKKELAIGPYHAEVIQIEEKTLENTGRFQGFRIEY